MNRSCLSCSSVNNVLSIAELGTNLTAKRCFQLYQMPWVYPKVRNGANGEKEITSQDYWAI